MPTNASGPMDSDWLKALHSSDSAWLITDSDLRVMQVNEGFTRMFDYSLHDMQNLQGLTPLQKLRGGNEELSPHIREQLLLTGRFCGELQLRHRNGRTFWVAANINTLDRQPMDAADGTAKVMVLTDIGFTKKFEALQLQMLQDVVNEKALPLLLSDMCIALEQIVPQVRVAVSEVSVDGSIRPLAAPSIPTHAVELMQMGRAAADSSACSSAAFLGCDVLVQDIAQHAQSAPVGAGFAKAGLQACWSSPIKNREAQVIGTLALFFETPRTPNELHRQLVTACLHLCTIAMERDANKHRIRQLAYFDALTALPNRSMFNECAQQALHAHRHQQTLLFFLDLDRFKLWNDSLGHAAGDALLCEVARRLGECTRPEDVVGRLSSDEFAVLMPHCTPDLIPQLAQRMLDAIAQPFTVQGVVTTPNACIGVCTYPEDGTDIEALLRHADQAMYAAKSQGSQRWQTYQPEMGQISQERAAMERELRRTLDEGGLLLHYQPQVHSGTQQGLYGLEALARWNHPEWGWVSPLRFITLAEDTGLIHALTAWLIDAACQQLASWRLAGLNIPHVSVNLSTNNFHDPAFAQSVKTTLLKHGLNSKDLVLEITESVMLDNRPATHNNLQALNALGLRLALDDFGTGYSSLSYLHRLPISELKLDKSFVHDVTTSSAASALTRSVLNIATSLAMTVVAEGVETLEQAQWLSEQGCPILQGYLYAKPMAPQDLPAWLEHFAQSQPQACTVNRPS